MAGSRWRVGLFAFAALVVVVEGGSLVGGDQVNQLAELLPGADKVLHTLAFLALSIAAQRLPGLWIAKSLGPLPMAAMLTVVAVGDELLQGVQSSRHLDAADLVASLCGIVLGLGWPMRERSAGRAMALVAAGLTVSAGVTAASYFEQRHVNAALRHARAGNFVEARREYRAAYEAGLRTAALFNELAWVELESGIGDPLVAVSFAERALAERTDDPDVRDTYGWALHHAGRSRDALPHLEFALRAKPDMFCIHYHLGEVYLALNETDKAIGHLRRQTLLANTREAGRANARLANLAGGR